MEKIMIYAIYAVDWTEYERGWGQRPDGKTYHKTKELADIYCTEYEKKYNNEKTVPDCYSKPGKPYLKEVSKEVWDEIQKKKFKWA
jgi:hypothetical protein